MTPYEYAGRNFMDALPSFNLTDPEKRSNESLKNKPAECKDGCPENQTCDYCGGDDTPCSCGHQDECRKDCGNRMELWAPDAEPEKEGEGINTLDVYLICCHDVDGKLVVVEGSSDLDVLKDNYLDPDGDEWIVKVPLPYQKMVDSQPDPLPVVEVGF